MVQVVVISPYPSVRAGLRALLHGDAEIEVVWEAAGVMELLAPWPLRPDVALVDDAAGAATLEALQTRAPELGIVLLGGDPAQYQPPWPAAPRGYLTRDANGEELAAAVRTVARGLTVIDPAIVQGLFGPSTAARSSTDVASDEMLTHREAEVLQLLAAGLPNKAIASRLNISEHTAKFHVSSVLAKLGAASRTEAVTTAARRGLLLL